MDDVKYDIKLALRHYRYLAAFIANAIDSMDWYLQDGYKVSTHIQSLMQSRADTVTIMAHMDKALETYKGLCQQEGDTRPYDVIMRKYVDPLGGSDGHGRPYTNEHLADLFSVSTDTIKRDLCRSYCRLRILFFGINGLEPKKGRQ